MIHYSIVVILSLIVLIFSPQAYCINGLSQKNYIIKYNSVKSFNLNACSNIDKDCDTISQLNLEFVTEIPPFLDPSDVEYIEPNYTYHTLAIPTDDRYPEQWGLKNIDAEKAWDITKGSKNVIVAVIDTGVDYNNKDLKENMWVNEQELNGKAGVDDDGNGFVDDIYGYDFVNNDSDPIDDHSHGTHCAGVIGAGHNGFGTVGINANVRIMALKFLDKKGSGETEGAIKSIMYAVNNGARVLSNSWGGDDGGQALQDAIVYARDRGVLFVAAAGNEYNNNDKKPTYPASYKVDNVLSVAAINKNNKKASFSNYGLSVNVAAPGVSILSTVLNNSYKSYDGTSMACPHVAGAAALLLSYENLNYLQIKERIVLTSDYVESLKNYTSNAGKLNINNMLRNIQPPRP